MPESETPPRTRSPIGVAWRLGYLSEGHAQFGWPKLAPRPPPLRRPTTLKLDGVFLTATESHSQFPAWPGTRRPPLARRATALHLDGEFATEVSETHDQFVEFSGVDVGRPEPVRPVTHLPITIPVMPALPASTTEHPTKKRLAKRATNLRLEGQLDISPEYRERFQEHPGQRPPNPIRPQDQIQPEDMECANGPRQSESQAQFVGYGGPRRRPPAKRHSTNLKMEGDIEAIPEYRQAYVQVHGERPSLIKPRPNLTPAEGDMFLETEKSANFIDFHNVGRRPAIKRQATNIKIGGDLEPAECENVRTRTSVQTADPVEASTSEISGGGGGGNAGTVHPASEYKDWYLDFPRKQPLSQKPTREYNFRFDSNLPSPVKKCPEPNFRVDIHRTPRKTPRSRGHTAQEYKASFVEIPRNRPALRRPDVLHRQDCSPPRAYYDSQHCGRRSPGLHLVGMIDFVPEYTNKSFLVQPGDDPIYGRDFSPRLRRRQRRVTYNVEPDTTEDSTDHDQNAETAFQILDSSVGKCPADSVADRVTNLCLDRDCHDEPLRSSDQPECYQGGSANATNDTKSSSVQQADSYCIPPAMYLSAAPYYCTGSSPPHHLYFGGFCPSWTPPGAGTGAPGGVGSARQGYSATPYCPSLSPASGGSAAPAHAPAPAPASPQYCPSILPPVHPYVVGCCPPPAIILPQPVEYGTSVPTDLQPPPTSSPATAPVTHEASTAAAPENAPNDTSNNNRAFVVLRQPESNDDNNNHMNDDKNSSAPGDPGDPAPEI